MPVFRDITNQRFGQLVAIEFAGKDRHQQSIWRCRCDCGKETFSGTGNLTSGNSTSCGHDRIAKFRELIFKHGKAHTKTYYIWQTMRKRCYYPKHPRYKYYGGRGIQVCDRWRYSFANFLADMGECPPGYSIERTDVNGNYEPANCKWIPLKDQAKNKQRRDK